MQIADHIRFHGRRVLSSPMAPVAVSVLLAMCRLGRASLWADEGETYGAAVHVLQPYEHPVTYFWFIRAWIALFGSSEFALRLPSALSAAGLVLVASRVAGHFPIPRLGIWTAWLTALSPFVLLGAQEARMYAPMALTHAVAMWGLVAFMRGHRRGAYLWAVGTGISTALHHLGWFGCWSAWLVTLGLSRRRRILLQAGVLALGLYAPLAVPTAQQVLFRIHGGHLGSTPSLLAASKKLVGQVYYLGAGYLFTSLDGAALRGLFSSPRAFIFLLQLVVPTFLTVRGGSLLWRAWRGGAGMILAFLVPAFLFLAYEGSPANLLLPVFLAYALPLAAGASVSRRLAVILLLILWVPAHVRQATSPGYLLHPEDWRGMTETIRREASADDAVLLTGSRNSLFMIEYYPVYPASHYGLVDSARAYARFDAHRPRQDRSVVRAVDSLLVKHPRVWYVYVDWDMPFMERSLDTLWNSSGRWRKRFGEGLELVRLERGEP